jgi:hypothetical protein
VTQQLTLSLEADVGQRYRSLLEVVAAGVYQRGVNRVAGAIDTSPSHLSEKLSGGGERHRKFSVEDLERYIAETGDLTPIHYLAARYCRDPDVRQREAIEQLRELVPHLAALIDTAGLRQAPKRGRR